MKKLLALILVLCFVFCLSACGADKNNTTKNEKNETVNSQTNNENTQTSAPKFSVKVVDADGNAVEGVMLQMCKDLCVPARTDADGVAVFNLSVTDGYKLQVTSCPEGYEYTGEITIPITPGSTVYKLEITKK